MTTTPGRADWRAAGACAQADPDLFFPISSAGRALGQIAKAKAVCAACPVRQPCLEFALEHDLVHGIWGGTTPAERQARRMAAGNVRGPARASGSPEPGPDRPSQIISRELPLGPSADAYDKFDRRADGYTKVILHPGRAARRRRGRVRSGSFG